MPLLTSGVEKVALPTTARFLTAGQADPGAAAQPLAMSADLWMTLKAVNTRVNRAIVSRADEDSYGVTDFWTTPLENGRETGDCEDYVLEKRRALLAEGLDPRALNIALATTSWGETHAVLLVTTSQGDYVLDNLSDWVRRWDLTSYAWLSRQLDGEAFRWVQVERPRTGAARMQLASLR